MKRVTVRVILPAVAILAPIGLEMSGYENMTLAIALWCICGVLLLIGLASWAIPMLPWAIVRKKPQEKDEEYYHLGIIDVPEEIAKSITDNETDNSRILELKTTRYEKRKKDRGEYEM